MELWCKVAVGTLVGGVVGVAVGGATDTTVGGVNVGEALELVVREPIRLCHTAVGVIVGVDIGAAVLVGEIVWTFVGDLTGADTGSFAKKPLLG